MLDLGARLELAGPAGGDTAMPLHGIEATLWSAGTPPVGGTILEMSPRDLKLRLLGDACNSFNEHCAAGIEPVPEKIDYFLHHSLMLVTALNRKIGYENAAKVAKTAYKNDKSLRETAIDLGLLSGEEFDELVKPEDMVAPR